MRRIRRPFLDVTRYLNDTQFARTYRLPRTVFFEIVQQLHAHLDRDEAHAVMSSGGRIEPAVRLAITLRILAGGSYLDMITNFNVGESTVYTIFHETVDILCRHLPMPGVPVHDESALTALA